MLLQSYLQACHYSVQRLNIDPEVFSNHLAWLLVPRYCTAQVSWRLALTHRIHCTMPRPPPLVSFHSSYETKGLYITFTGSSQVAALLWLKRGGGGEFHLMMLTVHVQARAVVCGSLHISTHPQPWLSLSCLIPPPLFFCFLASINSDVGNRWHSEESRYSKWIYRSL